MKAGSKAIRILERGLLLLGLLLLAMFAFAHIHRFIMFRAEMAKFETRQLESTNEGAAGIEATDGANHNADLHQAQNPDYSLWSIQRTKLYQASLRKPVESLAVLRIPALHLEVPVLEGTDEVTLNRGVGRIAGTSLPGQGGNIGIAGHRDGFFRRLKDIRTGDAIELVTIVWNRCFRRGPDPNYQPSRRQCLAAKNEAFAHAGDVLPILFRRPRSESLHRRSFFEVTSRAR